MASLNAPRRAALSVLACVAWHRASPSRPTPSAKPVDATKTDVDPLRTWAAPFLLVHPDNPDIMVAGMHEFRDTTCGLMRSTDGGATWTILDALANPASYPYCLANNSNIFQAPIAFGSDDRLYMGMAAWDTNDTRSKSSVAVARSDDLGDSWTNVIVHDARASEDPDRFSLRPITGIAVDTSGSEDTVSYRLQYQGQPSGIARPVEPTVAPYRATAARPSCPTRPSVEPSMTRPSCRRCSPLAPSRRPTATSRAPSGPPRPTRATTGRRPTAKG